MFFFVHINAQEITVDEFHQSSELTAQSRKTEKRDDDGNRYALIRVLTTDKGFHFDVGSIGSEPPDEDHVAEIWVYVGQGARHISISHKKYGTLERFDFPEPLQGGRTYIMKLKYDNGVINTFDNSRHQKIKLKVTPANSTFRLNGVKIALNGNGEPEEELELPYVTNQFSVEAEGYYKKDSIVSIDDNKDFKELTIELVPITGFLRVDANPSTAEVFIDTEFMGSDESDSSEILSTPIHDTGSVWLTILSFFLPILGLIAAYIFRKKNYIRNYKKCKKGAIIGLAVLAGIVLLFCLFLILATL